jgi:hypothetical protein
MGLDSDWISRNWKRGVHPAEFAIVAGFWGGAIGSDAMTAAAPLLLAGFLVSAIGIGTYPDWPRSFRVLAIGGVAMFFALTGLYINLVESYQSEQGRGYYIRHLTSSQKARLWNTLSIPISSNYAFDINSAPSCDECEQFAEELREFINTIPGWRVGGGAIIFQVPAPLNHGLWILAKDDRSTKAMMIKSAFADAGMPLTYSDENLKNGDVIVVIGRSGTN